MPHGSCFSPVFSEVEGLKERRREGLMANRPAPEKSALDPLSFISTAPPQAQTGVVWRVTLCPDRSLN